MGLFDGFAGAAVGALSGLTGSLLSNKQTAASTQAQMDYQSVCLERHISVLSLI